MSEKLGEWARLEPDDRLSLALATQVKYNIEGTICPLVRSRMSTDSRWDTIIRSVLDLIYPPHCVVCGSAGEWLCKVCVAGFAYVKRENDRDGRDRSQVGPSWVREASPPGLDGLLSVAYLEGGLREAIHKFKYEGTSVLAPYLADLMVDQASAVPTQTPSIVPVPLHSQRARQRGYNQSALLARELGMRIGLPVVDGCLMRVRATRPQVGLGAADRRRNVDGAFECTDDRLAGQDVLLIDDVCTTGATLESCARALRTRGSRSVWGLTLARERRD